MVPERMKNLADRVAYQCLIDEEEKEHATYLEVLSVIREKRRLLRNQNGIYP